MPDRAKARWTTNWSFVLLSLLTLVTFVVAQSVYEVLAANQDFLALRGVSNWQLLDVILVFNALPALLQVSGDALVDEHLRLAIHKDEHRRDEHNQQRARVQQDLPP